jgi:hypothetical protein
VERFLARMVGFPNHLLLGLPCTFQNVWKLPIIYQKALLRGKEKK